MKFGSYLTLIVSLLMLTGCAFGTRTATLSYPPEGQEGVLIESAQAEESATPQSKFIILTVSDERTERDRIGNVRNGFGMDTADVVTTNDVAAWVEGALVTELKSAGYFVTRSDKAAETGNALDMQAEIVTVYCDSFMTYDGEVSLMITVQSPGRDPIRKQIEGEGSVGMNWAATSKGYSESLSLALQDVAAKIITEIQLYEL